MPIEITFQPQGALVAITLSSRKAISEATVKITELCSAMERAGTLFFESLRPFVTSARELCDQYVARLAALTARVGDAKPD